jgi:hypothetical protein
MHLIRFLHLLMIFHHYRQPLGIFEELDQGEGDAAFLITRVLINDSLNCIKILPIHFESLFLSIFLFRSKYIKFLVLEMTCQVEPSILTDLMRTMNFFGSKNMQSILQLCILTKFGFDNEKIKQIYRLDKITNSQKSFILDSVIQHTANLL